LAVQATYSTRRVPIETKNNTYNRRSQTVSTVKKSQARIAFPCSCRKARQLTVPRLWVPIIRFGTVEPVSNCSQLGQGVDGSGLACRRTRVLDR
jgi:hypothetical protein